MKNKYLSFVSDEHFLKCVSHVCSGYSEVKKEVKISDLKGNGLDPFKVIFDIASKNSTFGKWLIGEELRQSDKTLNNRIGEFHQRLLGGVEGWHDLGIGDDTKLDLVNHDRSIGIELKNKSNTVNADSKDKVRDKLEAFITANPKSVAYWAYIISPKNNHGENVWKYHGRIDKRIRIIWGSKVYELVTDDANALRATWEALPNAINEVSKKQISKEDMKKLISAFNSALIPTKP